LFVLNRWHSWDESIQYDRRFHIARHRLINDSSNEWCTGRKQDAQKRSLSDFQSQTVDFRKNTITRRYAIETAKKRSFAFLAWRNIAEISWNQ